MMRDEYKTLIVEYLKRRYIEPRDIMDRNTKSGLSKVIWSTYIVPVLFAGLFAYDEVFIENDWNKWDPNKNEILNYKYIQFEWLWSDTLDSIRIIKCWMTQGFRMNNDKCEYERDDIINQQLFGEIREKPYKANSKSTSKYSQWYIDEIKQIFDPCTNLITNVLLKDRPNLLIGQWLKWNHYL